MPVYETDEPVLYERSDAIAWVSLNRPDYANSQNAQMLYALDSAFERAVADEEVRVIVLRGAGKHFSAGHDIGSPGRDVDLPPVAATTMWGDHTKLDGAARPYTREQQLYLGMCRRWREIPKPTIAAIHGGCIAGGLMLAWICDLIVATQDAFFSDPVLQMGIPGVEYFAHAFEMHPRLAREFVFLGERMTALRAYELGMVNRVVGADDLIDEVKRIAERLASMPAFGMTLAKQAFNRAEDQMGKHSAMDTAFNIHHLAHAHAQLTTGSMISGQNAKTMSQTTGDKH